LKWKKIKKVRKNLPTRKKPPEEKQVGKTKKTMYLKNKKTPPKQESGGEKSKRYRKKHPEWGEKGTKKNTLYQG
jgi:hypothetical protein